MGSFLNAMVILCNAMGRIKNLQSSLQFIYNQIIHSIPISWKDALVGNLENIKNLVFQDHHLIKNHQICFEKK